MFFVTLEVVALKLDMLQMFLPYETKILTVFQFIGVNNDSQGYHGNTQRVCKGNGALPRLNCPYVTLLGGVLRSQPGLQPGAGKPELHYPSPLQLLSIRERWSGVAGEPPKGRNSSGWVFRAFPTHGHSCAALPLST